MIQGLMVIPAIVAALMLGTDRRLINALRAGRATSAATAIPLEAGSPLVRRRLERLIRKGAIQTTGAGHYYINEIAWRIYRLQRRRRALTMIVILLPLTILVIWWTVGDAAMSSASSHRGWAWAFAS